MITPELVFRPIFVDHKARTITKWYAMWNDKIFVRETATGKKWLYNGKGKVRRSIVEAIELMSYSRMSCHPDIVEAFEVTEDLGYCKSHNSLGTCKKIEKWLDEQERLGVIKYVKLAQFK